jgi:hypothetical protein
MACDGGAVADDDQLAAGAGEGDVHVARGAEERRGEALLRPYHNDAHVHLSIAKEMTEKMGYHRRDKEVEELDGQLK